jgi:hypothetical protein
LVIAAGATADPATRTPFTGTDTYLSQSDPGTMWVSGRRVHIRGLQIRYATVTTNPRIGGFDDIVVNANFANSPDPTVLFTGPMWGTFHTENAGGCYPRPPSHGTWP